MIAYCDEEDAFVFKDDLMPGEIMESNVGSGGPIERAIFFIVGCAMGIGGLALSYMAYMLAMRNYGLDYQELYMGGSLGLAFFMLRGAWFTVIPQRKAQPIKLSHDR